MNIPPSRSMRYSGTQQIIFRNDFNKHHLQRAEKKDDADVYCYSANHL